MKEGDFVSSLFTRPKKDRFLRMILNLKCFNEFIEYKHFKMDSIFTALNLIKPGVFMASVDLKDAFSLFQRLNPPKTFEIFL